MARKKNLSVSDLRFVEREYVSGKTAAVVSKQLDFNEHEVRKHLRMRGLLRKTGFKVVWVGIDHIKCSKCNTVKPVSEIVYNTNNSHLKNGSYLSYCKACKRKGNRARLHGTQASWSDRVSRIRSRCERTGIECSIDTKYLEMLWKIQDGKCVYTQEEMQNLRGVGNHPLNVSVDRVDYREGYVPGNIVLCTTRANTIKHNQTLEELMIWMPLWYSRLDKLRRKL